MNFAILRKRVVQAIIISLIFHVGFLVWSYFARLMPPVPFPDKAEAVFHVKINKDEHFGSQKEMKFDSEFSPKKPRPVNPFNENTPVNPSIETEESVKDNIESSIQKNKQSLVPSTNEPTPMLKKSELNDAVMTKKVRRSVRENLVEVGEVPREEFASGEPVVNAGEDISRNFLDKSAIPSNTAQAAPVKAANTHTQYQMMKRSFTGIQQESKAVDLGTALTYQLLKYKDPAGQKYFKLIVKVRDATIDFPVIPKEVIFLLDASGSIGMTRLSQFKEGVIYSLKHLNPHDRFNIIVFKDKTIYLSPGSLDVSPDNIKTALDFLEELRSWSTTDIYDALRTSIDLKNPFVPSYRVVMSDGFPTKGIVDTRRVINEISKINNNKVSIFTFGGGTSVDPYMLDFIAFKNRGWSRVEGRDYLMGKTLTKLYNEIKDPLLLNVRYYVSGLDTDQIFPQTMPDFFKGSEFVIYGKYTYEEKFAIQIRGDMSQEKKQFIVSANFDDAALGDRQIAHDWAFHKIYFLISQLKYNENNQALLDAIGDLCAKFHIITPYSIDLHHASSHKEPQAPGNSVKTLPTVKK